MSPLRYFQNGYLVLVLVALCWMNSGRGCFGSLPLVDVAVEVAACSERSDGLVHITLEAVDVPNLDLNIFRSSSFRTGEVDASVEVERLSSSFLASMTRAVVEAVADACFLGSTMCCFCLGFGLAVLASATSVIPAMRASNAISAPRDTVFFRIIGIYSNALAGNCKLDFIARLVPWSSVDEVCPGNDVQEFLAGKS